MGGGFLVAGSSFLSWQIDTPAWELHVLTSRQSASVLVKGATALSGHMPAAPWLLHVYVFLTFFSYASFFLIGYLKDIDADSATNYKTFPVVWGWQKTMLVGHSFALATLLLFWTQPKSNVFEVVAGHLGSAVLNLGQVKGHFAGQKNDNGTLLLTLVNVRSFILLHVAIVLHFKAEWWPYLALYYIVFEFSLFMRPLRYQV